MENLTFGEQVKIILSRKGMTIKELAEQIEERTGKNMSRQNMTQRLKRDNFQEQDMRMIAEILGCSFRLSIMEQIEMETEKEQIKKGKPQSQKHAAERDITVGELVKMSEELQLEPVSEPEPVKELPKKVEEKEKRTGFSGIRGYMRKPKFRTADTKSQRRKSRKHRFLARSIRIREKNTRQTVYEYIQSGSAMYRYMIRNSINGQI